MTERKFYGTKESAGCRSKPLSSLATKDGDVQVLKSTIMDSPCELYWVHKGGILIGSVSRWKKNGDAHARMSWEGDDDQVHHSDVLQPELTGSGSLGMAVGMILAVHSIKPMLSI